MHNEHDALEGSHDGGKEEYPFPSTTDADHGKTGYPLLSAQDLSLRRKLAQDYKADTPPIRFVGGVMLTILCMFKKHIQSMAPGIQGEPLTDPILFRSYMEAIAPWAVSEVEDVSLKRYTSNYKNCKKCPSNRIIIMESPLVSARYHDEIRTREGFLAAKKRMDLFLLSCIDLSQPKTLAKAILERIHLDDSIPSTQHFWLDGSSLPYTKGQMVLLDSVDLGSLLVAVTDHLLTCERGKNQEGADALESMGPMPANKARDLSGFLIGGELLQDIDVIVPKYDDLVGGNPHPDPAQGEASLTLTSILEKMAIIEEKVNVILADEPSIDFSRIFVRLDITPRPMGYDKDEIKRYQANIHNILEVSKRNIVIGIGGSGKTMTMKGLFLDAVSDLAVSGIFPIFLPLSSYSDRDRDKDLAAYISRILSSFVEEKVVDAQILELIRTNRTILLLDGLDEIPSELLDDFTSQLANFIKLFIEVPIIITTRENPSMLGLTGFTQWTFPGMTIDQCVEVIHRYPGKVDPRLRMRFAQDLKEYMYDMYRNLLDNPQLLTLFLKDFEQNQGARTSMVYFLGDVFELLYRSQDRRKEGVRHAWYTSLGVSRYLDFLNAFAFISYIERIESFTKEEFCRIMEMAISQESEQTAAKPEDFFYDALYTVGIIRKDGSRYAFIHDIFQLYYSACFLSSRWDLRDSFMENLDQQDGTPEIPSRNTALVTMLFRLRGKDMTHDVFLPRFEKLLTDCGIKCNDPDIDDDDAYLTFLRKLYPVIEVRKLNKDKRLITNDRAFEYTPDARPAYAVRSTSVLYDVFMEEHGISRTSLLDRIEFPAESIPSLDGEFYFWGPDKRILDDEDEEPASEQEVIHHEELRMITAYSFEDDKGIAGYRIEIYPQKDYSRTIEGSPIHDIIFDDDFPLRTEFQSLCSWVQRKKKEFSAEDNSLLTVFGYR